MPQTQKRISTINKRKTNNTRKKWAKAYEPPVACREMANKCMVI